MPIPIPTLTITDNQNGTATFTITGSDPIAHNTIRCSRLEDPLAGWLDIIIINGNWTDTAPVSQGLKWFSIFSEKAPDYAVSPPVPAIITNSPTAIFEQCLRSVLTVLKGAATANKFGQITADRIIRQDVIDAEHLNSVLPAIIITPGVSESEEGGTNASDDFGYPIMIAVVDRKDEHDPANTATYLYWREVMRQLFHNRRLPGVPTSYKTEVNFELALDHREDDDEMNWFSTGIKLLCKNRETRWS